jgi:hypothetical protein
MMEPSDCGGDWERARRRAVQVRHFYVHALAFTAGNLVAFFINWLTLSNGDNPWWFQWGLLVWGTALAVHALTLMGSGTFLGPEWEQRKIAKYLSRDAHHVAASADRQ